MRRELRERKPERRPRLRRAEPHEPERAVVQISLMTRAPADVIRGKETYERGEDRWAQRRSWFRSDEGIRPSR